ncbi:MAG: hypothetical protein ABII96_08605, partial [Candidatus Zixiibacteriota bacterium]
MIFMITIICLFLTPHIYAASCDSNFVQNPGFEDDFQYWDNCYGYSHCFSISTDNPHSGSKCATYIFYNGISYYDAALVSQPFFIDSGTTYNLSMWVREKDTRDTYSPDNSILDIEVVIEDVSYRLHLYGPIPDWTYHELRFTSSKSGEAFVNIQIHGFTNTDTAYVFVDDVSLCEYRTKCGDVTCDNQIDIGDVVQLINYLFKGGPPPGVGCTPED